MQLTIEAIDPSPFDPTRLEALADWASVDAEVVVSDRFVDRIARINPVYLEPTERRFAELCSGIAFAEPRLIVLNLERCRQRGLDHDMCVRIIGHELLHVVAHDTDQSALETLERTKTDDGLWDVLFRRSEASSAEWAETSDDGFVDAVVLATSVVDEWRVERAVMARFGSFSPPVEDAYAEFETEGELGLEETALLSQRTAHRIANGGPIAAGEMGELHRRLAPALSALRPVTEAMTDAEVIGVVGDVVGPLAAWRASRDSAVAV